MGGCDYLLTQVAIQIEANIGLQSSCGFINGKAAACKSDLISVSFASHCISCSYYASVGRALSLCVCPSVFSSRFASKTCNSLERIFGQILDLRRCYRLMV